MEMSDEDARELFKHALYRTCFECKRQIDADDIITMTNIGPMPIYHHTACVFSEDETEEIKMAALEGEIIRKPYP